MPETYEERPPTCDAIQFEGTAASAFEINAWLSSYGATVTFDALRSRIIVMTSGGTFLPPINDTDWVTMCADQTIESYTDVEFNLKYKPQTGSPHEEPPVEEPPVEEPPVEEPPVEEPPVEEPPNGGG